MRQIESTPYTTQKTTSLKLILQTFAELLKAIDGEIDINVNGPCSQDNPQQQSIVFVGDEEHLHKTLKSSAAALVIPAKLSELAQKSNTAKKTLIASQNTYLSMALVNSHFFALPFLKSTFENQKQHPAAHISKNANVDASAIIGPGAVISDYVKIGKNSYIGANTVIEPHSVIGQDCFIHPQVYIGHNCMIANRVEIKPNSTIGSDGFGYAHDSKGNHYRIPHYGTVIIEEDVHIGANVNIDRGTFEPALIGAGTKIDNHCHLGHNARIGKNCLITAGFICAGSVTIGDNCVFGGRCSINGHITITDNCMFAGMSGISKSVDKPGKYGGFPAIEYSENLKNLSTFTKLTKMRNNLAKVMKQLGLDEKES